MHPKERRDLAGFSGLSTPESFFSITYFFCRDSFVSDGCWRKLDRGDPSDAVDKTDSIQT